MVALTKARRQEQSTPMPTRAPSFLIPIVLLGLGLAMAHLSTLLNPGDRALRVALSEASLGDHVVALLVRDKESEDWSKAGITV